MAFLIVRNAAAAYASETDMKLLRSLFVWLACCAGMFLASCETAPPATSTNRRTAAASESFAAAQQDRPGLGTGWGETRESRVLDTAFPRANRTQPLATGTIFYNDEAGVREMVGALLPRRVPAIMRSPAGSLVTVELRDQSGRLLPGVTVGDRWFVIGEQGRRYSILVRNRTSFRIEVVLSVDGLDVLDGRAASFSKRGYVVPPRGSVSVEGFRRSTDAVAAFRFSSVRGSYANQKYGQTRNVGVIGVAIFNEAGTDPLREADLNDRLLAEPFPGNRFATPPEPVPIRLPRGR